MLALHLARGHVVQLPIDQRRQAVERRLIAGAPGPEQSRNFRCLRGHSQKV
jgi:hypothetical protein